MMEAMNLDSIRVNIFRELMNLDKNDLQKLYSYVLTLVSKKDVEEKALLNDLLVSGVEYALEAHKKGEVYTTEEVRSYIEEQLGWKYALDEIL